MCMRRAVKCCVRVLTGGHVCGCAGLLNVVFEYKYMSVPG